MARLKLFAALTLYEFNALPYEQQLAHVFDEGTYLVQRWEDEGRVALYHLPDKGRGFFVEVGVDEAQACCVVLRSFSSSVPLEDYVVSVGCRTK